MQVLTHAAACSGKQLHVQNLTRLWGESPCSSGGTNNNTPCGADKPGQDASTHPRRGKQLHVQNLTGLWGEPPCSSGGPNNNNNTPCGADQPGQDEAFVFTAKLHDAGSLKLATDPVCLVKVVDEHELHTDVTTVHFLQGQCNGSTVIRHCR